MLEDIAPLCRVRAEDKLPKAATRVQLVPAREGIPFEQKDGRLSFIIPCVNGRQSVEIDME